MSIKYRNAIIQNCLCCISCCSDHINTWVGGTSWGKGLFGLVSGWMQPSMVWKPCQWETEALVTLCLQPSPRVEENFRNPRTVSSFFQQGPTSWSFYNLPKQHYTLGRKCSDTWAYRDTLYLNHNTVRRIWWKFLQCASKGCSNSHILWLTGSYTNVQGL